MKFRLLTPVKRQPASIAPYFYMLAAGRTVHLVQRHNAVLMSVSTIENPADRIAEDIFHISASEAEAV